MNSSKSALLANPPYQFPRQGSCRRLRGFTLVESLVVTAVVSILIGAASPAIRTTVKAVQLSAASNDLLAGLLIARSEAVKRHSRVVLCTSADGIGCAGAGGWEQGWIVFQDANNNGALDSGEAIVQRQQALSTDLRITGNANVAHYVSYAPSGTTKLVSGGFQAGTITLCHQSARDGEARQIVLSSAGRPRIQKTGVSRCA